MHQNIIIQINYIEMYEGEEDKLKQKLVLRWNNKMEAKGLESNVGKIKLTK